MDRVESLHEQIGKLCIAKSILEESDLLGPETRESIDRKIAELNAANIQSTMDLLAPDVRRKSSNAQDQTTDEQYLSVILRNAISKCGLSPYEIARRTGIADSQIYRFIHGKNLRLDAVEKLCRSLGIVFSVQKTSSP